MLQTNPVKNRTIDPTRARRIPGAILCRRRDEYGEIIVAEEGNKRTLYFGDGINQSTIRTDRPDVLLEDYNEAMMSSLIFTGEPLSILLIGLGGCSLVHFLLKAFPHCALDVVEIRQQVIDLAREYFFLPAENDSVRIFHAAGGDFIRDCAADSRNYDMIIVDAFDEAGPAASLLEKEFLSACRMRLNAHGVFVINLWNGPGQNFTGMYKSVQDAFENNTLKLLLAESYRNAVAFGFKDPANCGNLPEYRRIAADLQGRHGINFPRYLKNLYWQNFNAQEQ